MRLALDNEVGRVVILAATVAMVTAGCDPTATLDWSQVPIRQVTLFYPGQGGYQWLRGAAHPGATDVREGAACVDCHAGAEAELGTRIVAGGDVEPAPIPGKNGAIELAVQAAYDAEHLYLRLRWRTNMNRPGDMHNFMRFDGSEWAFHGGPRSSPAVRDGAQPPLYEDRLTIMLDDGSVPGFREQGCWLTCHQGMRDMPNRASAEQVQAHPVLGEAGLNKTDVRKFLPLSRTDAEASWDAVRPAGETAELKAQGKFVDLMQWRAARSNPVGMADDGYVLEYRLFDSGKNMFSWNVDRQTMTPKYMFDAAKMGAKALTAADLGDLAKPHAIIREKNAVPYDPDAGWREGDLLPGRLISRVDAQGSAADNSQANGVWKDGVWTVLITRKLDTGHPEDDKRLEEGGVYSVGFAVHDDNVTTRFHHVGFPLGLGIGVPADIEAVEVGR